MNDDQMYEQINAMRDQLGNSAIDVAKMFREFARYDKSEARDIFGMMCEKIFEEEVVVKKEVITSDDPNDLPF